MQCRLTIVRNPRTLVFLLLLVLHPGSIRFAFSCATTAMSSEYHLCYHFFVFLINNDVRVIFITLNLIRRLFMSISLLLLSHSPSLSSFLVRSIPLMLFFPHLVSILPHPYFSSSNTRMLLPILFDPRSFVFLFLLVLSLPLVLQRDLLSPVLHQPYLSQHRFFFHLLRLIFIFLVNNT
ncbi:hypothetical protein GEMRC1_000704 [Eukaryota sp. GEM-RC1]